MSTQRHLLSFSPLHSQKSPPEVPGRSNPQISLTNRGCLHAPSPNHKEVLLTGFLLRSNRLWSWGKRLRIPHCCSKIVHFSTILFHCFFQHAIAIWSWVPQISLQTWSLQSSAKAFQEDANPCWFVTGSGFCRSPISWKGISLQIYARWQDCGGNRWWWLTDSDSLCRS